MKRIYLLAIPIALVLLSLAYFGILWPNVFLTFSFSIKGIDVSHFQDTIDWQKVVESKQYAFAYIKATEGHDFVDDKFAENWKNARKSGLRVGAYHFFSMRSSGATQAEYFISVVPKENDALPPVIDLEISADQNKELVRKEVENLQNRLEKYYGKKPVLYVTYDTYNAYIKDNFPGTGIWVRDIITAPFVGRQQKWLIWQYTNRGRVPGINKYVDINVFSGNEADLKQL